MKDLQGRPYATVAETKVGSKLEADDDIYCIPEGSVLTVQKNEHGLFIACESEGGHQLAGQLSDDGTHYVGLYHVG